VQNVMSELDSQEVESLNEIKEMYFEFDIKRVIKQSTQQNFTILEVRDLTHPLKFLQKSLDMNYQDAIENNFSHEQMTPLNCILGNS